MLQWKKKPGEAVAQDEILIELETDKVVLEVPAPAAGVLAQVLQNDGDTVVADQVIATIDTEAKAGAAAAAAGAADVQSAAAPVAAPAPAAQPAAAASSTAATSPAASKLMAEKGIGAGDVAGSGRDGRITKGDVLSAGSAPKAAPAAAPAKAAAKPALPEVKVPASATTWLNDRPEQRVPMSRLRARIAERLLESQQTNAILTTFNEVNMQPVMDLRAKYKDKFEKEHGVKLGFMSFFVKAAVHALKKFPLVNASIDGNDIVYHGYFDIGIAVGSPRGLVVPILRNADQLSLAEIEKKIAEFGQKAKDGKLSIEEMTGGTFSISNGGVFGSMLSTPIINPPQSAILGVHATKERPVVENGQIVIRPINYLALSYDHRIIDGREAVLSLVAMKDALEDPARLLLDL
ncbi:dihydrolipoyllysine-residue succinyltransferase, E2 component of oxoglutarate dehydrogenase complex [Burkholderia mallei]|nr:dihydrolipoyllysine-residue succinyltransferase, E2 component of oxoglutarate dehydrogenase complex [Burkholderia mallei]KOS89997.1 dihydrolipoyllysine-residue succinyltransferase, E2 component of oxoglutarate dehydrogenase complex [Burkholderia mallei]KOS97877.1 dihydrolipoyllysine-residue succinyltransferase, E2 component of oxoglutarate dehydrogenase complex [Burkholderia mallei]KOT11398.1 dihydrolipoyllysine-residue succinyltransferase, E2 component of oxoglutarate dehydrogenase complex [